MSSPPKIRRYIPADRDATLAIWLEASRVGHGFLGEAELQKQKALVRDHYLDASETGWRWTAIRRWASSACSMPSSAACSSPRRPTGAGSAGNWWSTRQP